MAPDEVLAWISRQLALVGIGDLSTTMSTTTVRASLLLGRDAQCNCIDCSSGVDKLLEGARRALPPPPPLDVTGTPRLALPAEPCVTALDALLDVARGWLDPAHTVDDDEHDQHEAGEWPGASLRDAPTDFPESDYELRWACAQEALHKHVADVMRGLGLLGRQAPLPIPGASTNH